MKHKKIKNVIIIKLNNFLKNILYKRLKIIDFFLFNKSKLKIFNFKLRFIK